GELVVLAVALVFEGFQVAACVGDQSALHVEIAHGALELRDGGIERCFGGGHVGFHAAYVGLHGAHFSGNGAYIFLLLFRLCGNARGCGLLLTLQLVGTRRQFFLGHAQLVGLGLGIGFGGLHAL